MKTLQIIFIFLYSVNVLAIDKTFNYQGVLKENGVPANGLYDINISAYKDAAGTLPVGDFSVNTEVEVNNGLFFINNINLDISGKGDNPFDSNEELYIRLDIRESNSGSSFVSLDPPQQVTAVPFAYNLAAKGAFQGDVLTFDGEEWNPRTPDEEKWVNTFSGITYGDNVGIGTNPPSTAGSKLTIQSAGANGLALELRGYNGGSGFGPIITFSNSQNRIAELDGNMKFSSENELHFSSPIKQPINIGGAAKYLMNVSCSGSSTSINNLYNGVVDTGSSSFGILPTAITGTCRIVFPTSISGKYIQVMAEEVDLASTASCERKESASPNVLECAVYSLSTGNKVNLDISIAIF